MYSWGVSQYTDACMHICTNTHIHTHTCRLALALQIAARNMTNGVLWCITVQTCTYMHTCTNTHIHTHMCRLALALQIAARNIANGVLGYTCKGIAACMHGWEPDCVGGKVKKMWDKVCTYVCMYTYTCKSIWKCKLYNEKMTAILLCHTIAWCHASWHIHEYVCILTCTYTCIYVYFAYIYTYIYIYIYMHIFIMLYHKTGSELIRFSTQYNCRWHHASSELKIYLQSLKIRTMRPRRIE